jgi:tetratricopeptide (TPR) repeat protein
LVAATAAAARPALAEPSAADRALATALFRDGRALLARGAYAEACRKLEESQRLDPGGGTLLNVALCHELEGRTASAWAEFIQALSVARRDGRDDRAELAHQHVVALEPGLARLTVNVPNGVDLPGLTVRRDGTVIGRSAWGMPMPVDPGEHRVEASADGHVTWARRVAVAPSGAASIDVPGLVPAPAAERPATPAPAPGRPGRRRAGFAAAGVGVAAFGAAAAFALRAGAKRRDSDDYCDGYCSQRGVDLNEQAQASADVATVAALAGAAAAAAGLYLILTSGPKAPAVSARPWRGPRGFVLGGTF